MTLNRKSRKRARTYNKIKRNKPKLDVLKP